MFIFAFVQVVRSEILGTFKRDGSKLVECKWALDIYGTTRARPRRLLSATFRVSKETIEIGGRLKIPSEQSQLQKVAQKFVSVTISNLQKVQVK